MRILIIRLGAFGDIIHTLPLVADLARAGHELGWCCEDRWAPLLEGSPVIARLHRLPRRRLRDASRGAADRLAALGEVVRSLRKPGYDAVIDAQGLGKSALLALASGIGLRLGHAPPRAREGSWLATHRRVATRAVHVIDQQRNLATALDGPVAGAWRFPLPAWADQHAWAGTVLAHLGLVRPWILNVGAGWPTKVWPEQRQGEFLGLLRARAIPTLVVWGSSAEKAAAERVIAGAGYGVLAPEADLPRLAGLLARGAVVVSGDTGPLHLALAVGTPSVGLFGPVPAERNGPRGRGHRTLQAPGAAWERRDVSKVDMGAITAEQVFQAAWEAQGESSLSPEPGYDIRRDVDSGN